MLKCKATSEQSKVTMLKSETTSCHCKMLSEENKNTLQKIKLHHTNATLF